MTRITRKSNEIISRNQLQLKQRMGKRRINDLGTTLALFLLLPSTQVEGFVPTSDFAHKYASKGYAELKSDLLYDRYVQHLQPYQMRNLPSNPRRSFLMAGSGESKEKQKIIKQEHIEHSDMSSNVSSIEMRSMSILGLAFTTFILYSLTTDNFEFQMDFLNFSPAEEEFSLIDIEQETLAEVETMTQKVLGSAVPETATDVLSLVFGEGLAGSIGAVANVCVGILLRLREEGKLGYGPEINSENMTNKAILKSKTSEKNIAENVDSNVESSTQEDYYTAAVADGDYFLTRAAALPLLDDVGVSGPTATIVSVLIATVPYELIKLNARRQKWLNSLSDESEPESNEIDLPEKNPFQIDVVDIFADTTKWLEYTVLSNDFSSKLFPQNLVLESSSFGFLAAFSSQVYADILYRFTEYGPEEAKIRAKTRSMDEWISLYVSKCFASATLFGVYEYARYPIARFFQSVLTGGVDSCMGSSEFDVCIETFMIDNPPSEMASTEAQLRALFAAMAGLGDRVGVRFGELENGIGMDNFEGNLRGLAVSFYSIANHFLPLY